MGHKPLVVTQKVVPLRVRAWGRAIATLIKHAAERVSETIKPRLPCRALTDCGVCCGVARVFREVADLIGEVRSREERVIGGTVVTPGVRDRRPRALPPCPRP